MTEPKKPLVTINDLLEQMGEYLHVCPKLFWEWSLTMRAGTISDQDRVTCWVEPVQPEDLANLSRFLMLVNAPPSVLQQQQSSVPSAIRQGISAAFSEAGMEWRLYLHTRPPGSGKDQYASYRWTTTATAQTDTYQFYFFPETPEGHTPLDFVHPLFTETVQTLVQHERLRQMSGFWLRSRAGQVVQVDFALPWHPPLQEFAPLLEGFAAALQTPTAWINTYAAHPIRHIALAGRGKAPSCTVYFSAPASAHWPSNLNELKEMVHTRGQAIHTWGEKELFAHIPPITTTPDRSVGMFYDTNQVEVWQQVLGPKLHYHFGLFANPDTPPTDANEIEAAFEQAVTVLYPFMPVRGRVYDIGCGWGGTMGQLIRDLDCQVEGITASRAQFRYGSRQGLHVRYGDVETTLPAGTFDCMLLMESLCHMRDKLRLLKVLRLFGKRLVLRDHCQDDSPPSRNFGGTMLMNSSAELRQMVEEAGWNIIHWRNCRQESLPSVAVWHSRLQRVPPGNDLHLETLRAFCERVLTFPDAWAAANPLIELVAE